MIFKAADLFCSSCVRRRIRLTCVGNFGNFNRWSRPLHSYTNLAARPKTYYDILELPRNASKEEIRAAFVDLSKQHHPDRNPDNPRKHDKFVQINKAYNTLIRPESRREYDTSLAYHLHQINMARNMASMHAYDGTARPDNWTGEGDQQTPFHDEYIFHMRDKSKDSHYAQQPYYGFRGINKLSNTVIVWGCMGFLVVGALVHYVVISASSRRSLKLRDEQDKRLYASYAATKRKARLHGTDLQLSLLADRAAKTVTVDDVKSK